VPVLVGSHRGGGAFVLVHRNKAAPLPARCKSTLPDNQKEFSETA